VRLQGSPQNYQAVLQRIPPRPTPIFEDPDMQVRVWGCRWGAYNDIGPLKMVLVHRPGAEINIMTPVHYDPEIDACIDDGEQWYWQHDTPPDLQKMQREHDLMVTALRAEGVEVVYVDGSPKDPQAMYTRDTALAVRGGVIIGRLGPVGDEPGTGRRGEEAYVSRKLAELGMPILRTIHGSGVCEGGSFAFLDELTAVIGMSFRQNDAATRQIEEVLAVQGLRLIRVPLAGYSLHLNEAFVMVDKAVALVNMTRLPYWFLDLLQERNIRSIEVHPADNPQVVNCLAVRPGKVLLAINNGDATAERLRKVGVEVIPIDYAECQRNGGGIHCSTLPLIRERE
jgi:N-dimethylarginine dimethylaminohydrolase